MPEKIASAICGGPGLGLTSTALYCGDYSLGRISRVPFDGGAPTQVVTGAGIGAVAVKGDELYWLDTVNALLNTDVMKKPLDGGPSTRLYRASGFAGNLAVGPNVAWSTVGFPGSTGEILAVGVDGAPFYSLDSYSSVSGGAGVATDSNNVYWMLNGGALNKTPLDGGPTAQLVAGMSCQPWIVVDSTFAYWCLAGNPSTIVRSPLAGGATSTLTTLPSGVGGLAVDSEALYWTGANIMRVPLDGGVATPLVFGVYQARSIAVDSACVYWNDTRGDVWRVGKR